MTATRQLIVNADDFGQSRGVNRGIVEAHERGVVTSASLMVRWPGAEAAAAYARKHAGLSVGLHIDLGEWVCRDGEWTPLYEVAALDDPAAVQREVSRQLEVFRRLVGKDPTHLDSHQHVHMRDTVRPIAEELARRLLIPLRNCSPHVRHCGSFYGQMEDGLPYPEGISFARLLDILRNLPFGFTELGCHPGEAEDLDTMYRTERTEETRVLCDSRLPSALTDLDIGLRSFRHVRGLHPSECVMQ